MGSSVRVVRDQCDALRIVSTLVMFARGPRFPPEKTSEAPGPGHYKIPEEFQYESYKKGAFLDKADRFGIDKVSDVPGPGAYDKAPRNNNPRAGSSKSMPSNHELTHLQQELENLKSQHTRLLKEHQQATRKYEDKLMHDENTIMSLVKDNVALQSQVSTQQKEYRGACQREMALKSTLEKVESAHKNQAEHVRKFAVLQRKLEDLEKLQADEKKKYQGDIEHLKNELNASHKAVVEHSERSSSLRRQLETSEIRVRDLKKAIIGDQAEIKELRSKTREVDQARNHAISLQKDLDQTKKAMQNLETRRKAELSDRDTKLSQHEKALVAERRRREGLELRVVEAETEVNTQIKEAKDRCAQLEELENLRQANSAASDDRSQLCDLRMTLTHVANAYGSLAVASVPRAAHRQLQLQCASLQLRNNRLERRLADREALAEQLADYCRQASDEKALLDSMLQAKDKEFDALLHSRASFNDTSSEDSSLICMALHAVEDAHQLRALILQSDLQITQAVASLYHAEFEDVLVEYALAQQRSLEQDVVAARLTDACSEFQVELNRLRRDYNTAQTTLSQQKFEIIESTVQARALEEQSIEHERQRATIQESLKKEREANARLITATRVSKRNEEALSLEVDGLVEELQDARRYKEAHADLLAEVVELIRRNELAEEESERLSKFNAQIMGHTNPQQKIFYVDRIRRELANTKHQLMKSTRSREDVLAENAALQREVSAYKSIAAPVAYKPRNDRVRVERVPLASRSINGLTEDIAFELTPPDDDQTDTSPMTLDEIM